MPTSWLNQLPLRAVHEDDAHRLPRDRWPATVPAVGWLLDHGLEPGSLTILVGENGSGKSTIIEGLAIAYGLSPEGGSTGARHSTRVSESDLGAALSLTRGAGASRWGYFLRAETMHGLYTYLEDHPSARGEPEFHALSHGESFLAMLASDRFTNGGLFMLDEPEAGLSFTSQLTLVGQLAELAADPRTQVIMATHSPVLAAIPGADLRQLDDQGMTPVTWAELAVVDHYRRFLADPERYLRHVL